MMRGRSATERIHSANAITPNRSSVSSDMANRVSSLWLVITRSYTCNMYKVGVSMSRLATMLKMPTMRNSRRKLHRVVVRSLR